MNKENPNNIVHVCGDCIQERKDKFQEYYKDKNLPPFSHAKVTFIDDDVMAKEHMWVCITGRVDENNYEGYLDNDPVMVKNIGYKAEVLVNRSEFIEII